MTKHRVLLWILLGVMAVSVAQAALAAPPPKEKTPPVGQRAGAISALLPVASVTRGAGKTALKNDLKKGDPLFWNDLVQTAKGGRARITLADQSILSLGSQAELRIVKHDAKTQQTLLQMTYGRVRAEVSQITRDGGRFEVRTPTAVAGVIGTDFGTESGVGSTTFVCLSGMVSVSNSDPNVPGSVQCGAGQTTTVATGKAPTTPVPATPAQIQQLITDTEPAQISAMSPAAALPGATLDASVSGTKLSGTNAVQVAGGAGVIVSLNQGTSDSSASLHLVVAANAAPGPRTITLAKASGTNSATVFTVLAPPNTAQNSSGDPKKPYHDTLDQLRQTGDSSLGTIVAALQQIVDQANQALSQANQNLAPGVDLSQANSGLSGQISALQSAVNAATQQIDQAAGGAASSFDTSYTSAYNALLQRNSAGTPDDTFSQAVNTAFQNATNSLQQAIVNAQNSLNSQVQTAGNQIGQISQTWLNTINTTASSQQVGPTPASNGIEKSVDVGGEITLDASNSKAGQGASIVSYNWSLCDASYKPAQFGVPLVGNPAGCNALPGLMSSNAQFTIATCSLAPGDYIARETVVDTNQKIASQDVKIHVLAGSYDDPATRLKNLAAAYSALQVSQFLSYFDQTNFSGYTALSQNVQSTFPNLASMNINVIVSQNTQTCNQANLRANWDLNYQSKPVCSAIPVLDANGQPTGQTQQVCSTPPLLKASEQLQVRMTRTPGVGWLVTDFQGDNGTVTNNVGALPAGPSAATFSAEPDVVVAGLQIANSVNANNAVNVAGNTATNFTVTVANTGDADLTAVMPVHFAIRDGSGNELVSANQNIPTPLAKGATAQMTVSMAVPNLAPQTPLSYVVTANPGCSVTEKNCGADDVGNQPFLVGIPLPDLRITGISYSPVVPNTTFVAPGQETFTVNLINAGTLALTAPTTVHFVFSDSTGTQIGASDQNIPVPLNGGASTSVAATFTVPASGPGAQFTLAAVANPGCTVQEVFCANDPLQSANVKIAIGQANYVVVPGTLTFGGKSGPFTGASAIQVGTSPTVGVTVQNAGNISQSGSITVTFACSGPAGCNNPLVATISAPAAGQSVIATANTNGINNTPGTYTGTATLSTNLPQSSTADDSASEPFDVLDYTLTSSNATANPITVFLGGNFNLSALVTETGSTPFPMPITSTTTNSSLTITAPTTLTSGSAQNVNVAAAFTSATGNTNLTVSASNQGITKTIVQPLSIVAPFVQTVSPNMQSGLTSQALTLQVNTAGSLTLGALPNGVSIDSKGSCSAGAQTTANATVRVAGNVTWCLQASANSATGALSAPVSMTATNPADFAGAYTVPVTMSVNGVPDYEVNGFSFIGHAGSFTGSDALQVGESPTANIIISNIGNASPVTSLIVSFACAPAAANCATPIGTTVSAPAAGGSVTVPVALGTVSLAPGTYTATWSVSSTVTEVTTANNSASTNFDVVDFTLVFQNGSLTPITLVQGQTQNLSTLLTETGTTVFPLAITANSIAGATVTAPSPLTSGAAQNVTVATTTSTGTGTTTLTVTATNHGVPRTASQTFTIVTGFTQTLSPALTQGAVTSNGLAIIANAAGSLTLGPLPTGITLDGSGTCATGAATSLSASVTAGQTVTWCLFASASATGGAGSIPLQLSNTNVTYTGNVNFSVGAAPNYVVGINDVQFVGHATPYTGPNAIQKGEVFSATVTIHNTGTASPAGTIAVHLACMPPAGNNTTQCQTPPPDQTVAAPAVGNTAQVTFSGLQFNDPVGVAASYTGTVTITATDASNNPIPEQSTTDNTASTTFDITDFTIGLPQDALQPQGGFAPYQNMLQSTTSVIDFLVLQNGTATQYSVSIVASGLSNTSIIAPSTASTNASLNVVSLTTTASTPTGTGVIAITGTHFGVSHTVNVPVNVLAEQLALNGANSDGTKLYLNDASSPLELQIGAATPTTTTLKLTGTDFSGAGSATISIPAVTGYITAALPASVNSNGTVDVQSSAIAGASPTIVPITINAQIPNTNPQASVTFPLQVKALGVPDLMLSNFTVSGNASPWLSGQGMDFSITLNNNGGSASAGGEAITGTLTTSAGNSDLGCQVTSPPTGVPSIPGNGTTTVTVHCVAPDLHDATYSGSAPISFKIAADAAGDLNYANNRLNGEIPFSNWHATVSCALAPCGASDTAPLTLTIVSGGPTWSANSNVIASLDGAGSNTSVLNVGIGALSSGLNLLTGTPSTSPGGSFTPTVSTGNGNLQNGFYFAQLTLSLTDAVTGRTATRQATIHVSVNNLNITSPTGRFVSFTASCAPSGGGTGCMANTGPVQINGALAQQITATGSCTNCPSGGTYDFSVHDDALTSTDVNHSGAQTAPGVAFGAAQTLTVTAAQDATGNIATGETSAYTVNATAAQLSRARGISPDTGGVSQLVYFNVGDIDVNVTPMYANSCVNVPPNGPPVPVTVNWGLSGGFNQPSISYQLENSNNSPVGSGPIVFGGASPGGTLAYSGNYSALTFQLSNSTPTDGLQAYYLAVTITNGISSATKYFPFYVDGSLAQNFCGAASAVRGGTARIRGTWNRAMLGGLPGTLSAVKSKAVTTGKGMPDLRISSSDITYSPSIPKAGDTVSFRFRITNAGDGDAVGVPVALQVNGVTVASDTFDVRAGGSTLAGLSWTASGSGAAIPAAVRRAQGIHSLSDGGDDTSAVVRGGLLRVSLALAIDPQHTIPQKTTLAKVAAVPRFGLQAGTSDAGVVSAANSQRILLEIEEGACVGLRLTTGSTGMCGSADVEFTVEDLAKGAYKLAALNGVGDLGLNSNPFGGGGISAAQVASVRYASDAVAQAGHSYSVELSGGRTGTLTIASVRSPGQLDAKTRAIFHATAIKVLKGLGADSQAPSAPGDISGLGTEPVVFVELLLSDSGASPALSAPSAPRGSKNSSSASRVQ